MPSIANQDYKVYGLLDAKNVMGIRGDYCGELYAAVVRSDNMDIRDLMNVADSFVFISSNDGIVRQVSSGFYYDSDSKEWKLIGPLHENPAYYDALWAIQQAEYAADGSIVGDGMNFFISGADGSFNEDSAGLKFINEDGYLIKGTAENGKLASLSLGEKVESTIGFPIVSLETLLPLVGELPLGTSEIW